MGGIPEGEGEHPDEPVEGTVQTPPDHCLEHYFSVAGARKLRALPRQFFTHLQLYSSPFTEDVTAVWRHHRLPASVGGIHDCQPAVSKSDSGLLVDPKSFSVRTPVSKRRRHLCDDCFQISVAPSSLELPATRDPAHASASAPGCRSELHSAKIEFYRSESLFYAQTHKAATRNA
jgi:hypothetical protein